MRHELRLRGVGPADTMAPGPLGIRVMRSAVDVGEDASGIHSPAPTSGRVADTRKGCNVKICSELSFVPEDSIISLAS